MSPAAGRGRQSVAVRARAKAGPKGSLTIVGTGIRLVGQATLEAVACMERSEKLLYLVTNPVTEAWIHELNPRAESLSDCYAIGKPRRDSYAQMVERILSAVRAGVNVCGAFYGHPGVFVRPSHEAVRLARLEGFPARMLPGVSAEDCLFADLGVDPADEGCQSFEATEFLARRRRFDSSSSLILWQIAAIGEESVGPPGTARRKRLQELGRFLERRYPRQHEVVVYEAAQLPVCDPTIVRVKLSRLASVPVSPLATLYVPPVRTVGKGAGLRAAAAVDHARVLSRRRLSRPRS